MNINDIYIDNFYMIEDNTEDTSKDVDSNEENVDNTADSPENEAIESVSKVDVEESQVEIFELLKNFKVEFG